VWLAFFLDVRRGIMLLLATLFTATLAGGPQWVEPASAPTSLSAQPQQADAQQKPAEPPAEQKAEAKEPPTPPHTGIRTLFRDLVADLKHIPSRRNFAVLALGGGLAAAAHPWDDTFNIRLRSHYDAVNTAFSAGKYLGNTPEQVALSLGTYAYGRIRQQPKVSHMGMDLLQAQIMSEILVEPLKFATRRQRPDLSNRLSFPSGHSAVTFAAATVIERHLGWRRSVLGYTIASYVAASRLHDNRHHLSDVIFGAAVGTAAGRAVVHHKADEWAFVPAKVPGGVVFLVTRAR
jgi:membrane-associated phospholipid phosphatase